ncbi:MAG TPA: homoserine kinase [Bacteroidota bacterium]|nr:homoserine kinase [Bacteroidota bacterium]
MRIQIPASTSNIGPGFDTLGLALNRYLFLSASPKDGRGKSPLITVTGNGTEHIATDEKNLVYRGMLALAEAVDASTNAFKELHLRLENGIPSCGGVGGSGAAIAGGIFLANELLKTRLTAEEMLRVAVELEGHPDNVSAALMGGLTINCFDDRELHCRSVKITAPIAVVTCSPNFQVLTQQARQILPREISLKDAVANIENVASLVAALIAGDIEALRYVTGDRLHERYRAGLIPGYEDVRKAALGAGALSFNISGSGPTVFCFATEKLDAIGAAMEKAFAAHGKMAKYEIMTIENEGARIVG